MRIYQREWKKYSESEIISPKAVEVLKTGDELILESKELGCADKSLPQERMKKERPNYYFRKQEIITGNRIIVDKERKKMKNWNSMNNSYMQLKSKHSPFSIRGKTKYPRGRGGSLIRKGGGGVQDTKALIGESNKSRSNREGYISRKYRSGGEEQKVRLELEIGKGLIKRGNNPEGSNKFGYRGNTTPGSRQSPNSSIYILK